MKYKIISRSHPLINIANLKKYLRIDHEDDDDLIKNYLLVAVEFAENFLGLAFGLMEIQVKAYSPFISKVKFPKQPFKEIVEVQKFSKENISSPINKEDYYVDFTNQMLCFNKKIMCDYLQIIYKGGFKDESEIPLGLLNALYLHASELYDKPANSALLPIQVERAYLRYRNINF